MFRGLEKNENRVALTVDLEFLDLSKWRYSSQNTSKYEKAGVKELLKVLEKFNSKITFFTLANLCYKHLEFLKEIRNQGHEIASHSLNHKQLNKISDEEIVEEVHESKRILEEKLDVDVKGFRAPLLNQGGKVLEEIERAGYDYDSSMLPSVKIPGWYGGDDVPLSPSKISDGVLEFPLSINPIFRLPISGFFLRFFGKSYLIWSIKELHNRGMVPILYIHPFELRDFKNKNNWRQKLRTGKYMIKTLRDLIKRYELLKLKQMYNQSNYD